MAGIERINPDNIDLEDWEVWKDIREDTTGIFQMESNYAEQTMKEIFSDTTIKRIKNKIPDLKMLKLMSFANALIRPCGTSVRENAIKGIVKENGIPELDELLSNELGLCIIQEDIMLFLMKFCGYDLLKADMARKAIAKKKGTESLLPEIRQGFIENSKEKYNLSNEQVNNIIDPILQCILDATRYAFSWNHSDAYSFIGYACGYLRHYYPLEFYTTCLNIWSDKQEKTALVSNRIKELRYKIKDAQFRYSRAEYYCDKSTQTIYKGIASIKHLNSGIAEELYSLRNNSYNSFTDLLVDISNLSVNARQMEILIKLDFFKEFGNSLQLMKIWNWYVKLKKLKAKNFKISVFENNPVVEAIVVRHSNVTATQYTKLDCYRILLEIEEYAKLTITDDYPFAYKIETQKEYLGYISYKTDKQEDRPKILIMDIKRHISKFGADAGKPWAVSIDGYSLGSGKRTNYTIYYNIYNKKPFVVDDVIYIDGWEKNKKGYFYINSYHMVDKK